MFPKDFQIESFFELVDAGEEGDAAAKPVRIEADSSESKSIPRYSNVIQKYPSLLNM